MTHPQTLQEFNASAAKFAAALRPLPDRATVVGLYGELGAGKTTFVQAAAKALGVREKVKSPTFLIMKSYQLPHLPIGGQATTFYRLLVHIDAYRLKHSEELQKLGFSELLRDPYNLIFVEWADKVSAILPSDHRVLQLP